MRKRIIPLLLLAATLLSGCGSTEAADILVPIYDSSDVGGYKTATASFADISETASIAGKIGYVYEEELLLAGESNILEYNVKKGARLNEGDVIAVFDSSAYDYDYQSQKILMDSAYQRYASSGSEYDRLVYEQEKTALDLIQYQKDQYTIKAPYDCVVTNTQSFATGSVVAAGTAVCTVARPDEVYVYTTDSVNSFATGMKVKLKFGTNDYYDAKVVMTPDKSNGGHRRLLNTAVIIAFEDGEYERVTNDVGNIVSTGWATIIVKTVDKRGALCIPADAVIQYSGSTYCYLENNGSRARVPIEVGNTYSGKTVVLSGLSEGDSVSYR